MSFNYKEATLEELKEHIKTSPATNISRIKRYHTEHGNMEIVKAINKARKEIAMDKLNAME